MCDDASRLAHLANCSGLNINRWIVQLCFGNDWYTEYFKKPDFGTPKVIHPSKLDALRAAIDASRAPAEVTKPT